MKVGSLLTQLKRRLVSVRMLTLLIIWCFMLDLYLAPYRQAAVALGLKDAAAILPHLQNDFYFNKIMLLGIMCFFSNVPFVDQEEFYSVVRLGKRKWGIENIYYILASGFLLSAILTILSILFIFPAVNFSNDWGNLFQTFSLTGSGIAFEFNQQAMASYTPYALQLHIFLIDFLAFSLIGMILYMVSLFIHRIWAYAIVVVLVFLPSFVGKLGLAMDIFSPFSWLETIHWRFGYDNSEPDLVYIYTAYALLIFIVGVISQIRIQRMDWQSKEDNR